MKSNAFFPIRTIMQIPMALLSDSGAIITPSDGDNVDGYLPIADLALQPDSFEPTETIKWKNQLLGYTVWNQLQPHRTEARYEEWATIHLKTTSLPDGMTVVDWARLSIVCSS